MSTRRLPLLVALGIFATFAAVLGARPSVAQARMCAPNMYCPTQMLTIRGWAASVSGSAYCSTFQVTNSTTGQGYGQERTCMGGEPAGNIVEINGDGSVDWSANGHWAGPPSR